MADLISTERSAADFEARAGFQPDAPSRPAPVRAPSLGPLGWARWAWRQLTSMRTALLLLLLLALAAVPGSVLPQRDVDPTAVAAYAREHSTLFPLLNRLGFFDVFASPWFSATYLLLFISLTGCVLPRTRAHWTALRARPPAAPRVLDRLPVAHRWETDATPQAVAAAAHSALRAHRFRVDLDAGGAEVRAEKGYLRETGNLLFHAALLLLLVAVAAGHFGGYRANVLVTEGRSFSNSVVQYDEFAAGPWVDAETLPPFTVTLDRLDVRYEEALGQLGAPRDFTASVRYRPSPDAPVQTSFIRSNQPLQVDGTKVFLLGNGYAPRFTVRDGRGRVVLQQAVPLLPKQDAPHMTSNGALKVPDAVPEQLGLNLTFLPTAVQTPFAGLQSGFPDARNPRVLVEGAWKGELGMTGSVYRLDTTRMTRIAAGDAPVTAELVPGDTLTLPDGLGTVTFDGVARFANFSVAGNPGRGPALGAAALALAGLLASLYVRRRRVWVRATPAPVEGPGSSAGTSRRTVVEIGALARSEYDGLGGEVDRIVEQLHPTAPAADAVSVSGPAPHDREDHEWATPPSRS